MIANRKGIRVIPQPMSLGDNVNQSIVSIKPGQCYQLVALQDTFRKEGRKQCYHVVLGVRIYTYRRLLSKCQKQLTHNGT